MSPAKEDKTANRILTSIFKHVSTEESMIELRRQDLALHANFDCKEAFKAVSGEDDCINVDNLLAFLEAAEVENVTHDLAEQVIREFDGSRDGKL